MRGPTNIIYAYKKVWFMLTHKRDSGLTTVPKDMWGVDSKPCSKRSKNWQLVTESVTEKMECHTHRGGPREIKQIKAIVRRQKTNHNYRSLPTDENTLFIRRKLQHAIWKLHFCEIKYLPLHLTVLCVLGCGKNTTHAKRKSFLQIKMGMQRNNFKYLQIFGQFLWL